MSQSKSANPSQNVQDLFQSAVDTGAISDDTLGVIQTLDYGVDIQNALGNIDADSFKGSEVFLGTVVIDDSSSIRFVAGNTEAVREGHNQMVAALDGTKQKKDILLHARTLNRGIVYAYCSIADVILLNTHNYNPDGGTPLYDVMLATLASVVAKTQDFEDQGLTVRTQTFAVTDGADCGSRSEASDVAKLVRDMLRAEKHIIGGMGIDDGTTDFRSVFRSMGIPDNQILTPKNSPSEIRKAWAMKSKSMVRASQNAGSFSKVALGGFGSNP